MSTILRRKKNLDFNKQCSKVTKVTNNNTAKKDSKVLPIIKTCVNSLFKRDRETQSQCALSHELISFKDNDYYEKYKTKSTITFPAICRACLAYKFGLIEKKMSNESLLGCSILKLNYKYEEGPYLCVREEEKEAKEKGKRDSNSKVAFRKDTVIIPCGYWLYDILMGDTLQLFNNKNLIPKILKAGVEYTINQYIFNYFRSIYKFLSTKEVENKFMDHVITYLWGLNETDPNFDMLGTYELDSLFICGLVQPTYINSIICKDEKNAILTGLNVLEGDIAYEILYDKYKNEEDMEVDSSKLIEDYTKFLLNYIVIRKKILEKHYSDVTGDLPGRQIASFCIPSTIISDDDSATIYRKLKHNVIWVQYIGLVAYRDIYYEEMLIIETILTLGNFKHLKIQEETNE